MSSPKATKAAPKRAAAKSPAKSSTKAAKPAGKASRAASKPASDEGMTGQDKANFIKAMMEGIAPKDESGKRPPIKVEKPKKVEILRKISAPTPVARQSNPLSDEALAFAAKLEEKFANGDFEALTPEATQALMTAICKLYSANAEAGNKFPVVKDRFSVTGTDAMILCGALLKAVDLQVFELGMWQSWSGI